MDEREQGAISFAIIVPAYRPDGRLLDLIRTLSEKDAAAIVLVDDGSGPDYCEIFHQAAEFPQVQLVRHAVNLGHGAALKTGINYALCTFPNLRGVIMADADRRYSPDDIIKVAGALAAQPDCMIQGVGAAGSRLRAIPAACLPRLLRIVANGDAFERKMRFALWEASVRVVKVPIRAPIRAMEEPRSRTPRSNSTSLMTAAAVLLIAVYFLWLSGGGLHTGFSHDDLMNMWRAWREPLPRLLLDNLRFFASPDSYRPFGGLFYHIFFNIFGLHPLPFRLCLLGFLLANIYLTYAVTRRLSGSPEIAAITALLACYHPGLMALYCNTGNCYEIFCLFFYLCAFLYYIRIRERDRLLRPIEQICFLALLICALNAKEMAVTLAILIGVYEVLYHRPPDWSLRRLIVWLFREGRMMCWGLLFDLVFLIGKVYAPRGIARATGYSQRIRLSSYAHTLQHQLDGIFFTFGSTLFRERNLVILLLLLFLIAWRLRLTHFRFALLFWLIGILPVAFGPPPGLNIMSIPLVGLSICAATLLVQIRKQLWHGARLSQAVTFALLALILMWVYTAMGAHDPTQMDETARRIGSVITQLRAQVPQVKEGAHMLFLKDPFDGQPHAKWTIVFLTSLLYRDSSLSVDRLSMMPQPPDAERLKLYDYVFTMDQDKLVLVSPQAKGAPSPSPPWTPVPVLSIILGAGLTVTTVLALGFLLLNTLQLKFYSSERVVLAFVCGAALLSNLVFLIATAGWAFKSVFCIISGLAIAGWILARRSGPVMKPAPLPLVWKFLLLGVMAAFSWYYLSNAMAPEVSPDAYTYHLGLVYQYARAHALVPVTTNFYACLSEGLEMLFLFAFSIGRHSAAAMVHCAFLYLLPLAMVRYGQRYGMAIAGVCGAVLAFAAPVVGMDGAIAYNDVAAACVVFVTFYLLQIWTDARDIRLVALAGLCAGFAYAIKYPVGLAVVYGLAVICFRTGLRLKKEMLRSCAVFLMLAAVSMAPWMIRDWLYFGNPVAPFANRIFPNSFMTVEFEDIYRTVLAHANGLTLSEMPWQVTVAGGRPGGLFGCVFLLAPIALLSLTKKQGRQLMFAALLFALPVLSNKGSRFLIPAIPFLSLAMGMALARLPLLAGTVILAHAITSWPPVVTRYAYSWAWRLNEAPWAAALRVMPEEQYLTAHIPNYPITKLIEQQVPADGRVFSVETVAASYCTRNVTVGFGTAEGVRLRDTLWDAIIGDYQPMWRFTFNFGARPLYGIRLVETAPGPEIWKIAEITMMRAGIEVPMNANWQLTAKPFPSNANLAVDRSLITYWRSDRALYPGMLYQIRFGGRQAIDSVAVDFPRNQWHTRMKLEGEVEPGHWQLLAPNPAFSSLPVVDLRRAATAELRRSGIGYIANAPGGFINEDVVKDPDAWGLIQVGEAGGWRLYRIQ